MKKILLGFTLLASVSSFAQTSVEIIRLSDLASKEGGTHQIEIEGTKAEEIFNILTEYYLGFYGQETYRVGSVNVTEKKGNKIYCRRAVTRTGYEDAGKKEFTCLLNFGI